MASFPIQEQGILGVKDNGTIYHLYPDGKRIWIAATEDNSNK
jgi:hypothetical protein